MKKSDKSKVSKKRVLIIHDIDNLYKIINKTQLTARSYRFSVSDMTLVPIVDNVLKDSLLDYVKSEQKTKVLYSVSLGETVFNKNVALEDVDNEFFKV